MCDCNSVCQCGDCVKECVRVTLSLILSEYVCLYVNGTVCVNKSVSEYECMTVNMRVSECLGVSV